MRFLSLTIASLTISSIGLVNSSLCLGADNVAQLDNLENIGEITVSVLDRLGYDCDTVADVGLVCKKCSSDSVVTEKCEAYVCDVATRKCRKQEATLPKLPDSDNEEEDTESNPEINTDILRDR